ncbi:MULTISPECIES: hypothetical protein [Bradyrhizobium]|uniref:hypothetical protein n=1 Tax=Bradyrhizobium TaxID=374 RepID=UPI001008E426|nr:MULTISPECIES: hypothetical protein [Bradyrhizobium]
MIKCYDCGGSISFSAIAWPHCGSREPAGPYTQSSRERRQHRIEEKNDQTLIGVAAMCSGMGALYGAVTAGALSAFGYGLLGAIIGVPTGFIVNVSRRLLG